MSQMPRQFGAPTDFQIDNRFKHHAPPPGSDVPRRYETVRNTLCDAAKKCRDVSPVSPEQTRAINHLEESMFLFNASIARADPTCLPDIPRPSPGRYVKKPVAVEAFQWTADIAQAVDPVWAKEALESGVIHFTGAGTPDVKMVITTSRGTLTAQRGDWIVKGVSGEIYPCSPEGFAAKFEAEFPF